MFDPRVLTTAEALLDAWRARGWVFPGDRAAVREQALGLALDPLTEATRA
jgi:hypothetical protein